MSDDLHFVDVDVTKTLENMITVYEAVTERKLYPADPVRLFLLTIAKLLVMQQVLIDSSKKMDHLRFARGEYLDLLGERYGVKRLEASSARTTIRFMLSALQTSAITIPLGTRVTSGDNVYFTTIEAAEIRKDSMTVDVSVECVLPGTSGNGYLPGQLTTLVDPIPFVASVTNLTTTLGGADTENDDSLRERIRLSLGSFSVAGPHDSYVYWAKTASPAIIDVAVNSPSVRVVRIVPLLAGGEIPSQDVLDSVADVLNDRSVRPLTDKVEVAAPVIKKYNIDATFWIHRDNAAEATTIQAAVQSAVSDYALWQKSKLGRAMNQSELIRRVMAAGAYRVNVTSPVYAEVGHDEVAIADAKSITYGGMVDD
ncbi:baseplate J/gp47 family protein [Paenibacillus alvei]|uniref:Baseplate J/gp47 family protein n=1 Tax=Paenibacillus alvei TaxID=44250 RepID=A0ABT4H826_PAEAL|nr:baseplate J/gp47 family protein [Paenibacillus alvei]MCY7486646.1 baseplate J/gp47 family protein [Paenibacillus alvei]MCY9764923.1 baseplate J/gp47 family protein [Paenibacillus alvei]MCY9771335.1 baseplate J/gp47 family protein [Paenibacillus alvei]